MKIALSADFHLDIRQFNNQQRWLDFLDTFINVTRRVKTLNPDVYIIAGDIFHKYRPHPGVVRRFLKEISSFECPVILIRGNHDSPRILFERYGGDTLHLVRDVADIIYLNKNKPKYELGDICFIGMGYVGFNASKEIEKYVGSVETDAEIKIGIFHQLLDYPGFPENRAEISRGFLKGLGLDYVLMGHYHVAYSEDKLYNPGSPEYWSFDQAEQVRVNLDTMEEIVKSAKKHGFYFIDTDQSVAKFFELEPARSMYCVTYETNIFNEPIHLPRIKEHLQKYNIDGAMVKTIINGRHKHGRLNLSKSLRLEKPLVNNTVVRLASSSSMIERIDHVKAQVEYLIERGIDKVKAKSVASWLEHNKKNLAAMQADEILKALREILKKET